MTNDTQRTFATFLGHLRCKLISQRTLWVHAMLLASLLTIASSASAEQPMFAIHNVEAREVSDIQITVSFKINGEPHTDYEFVGDFRSGKVLALDGRNGTFDTESGRWVGDFLYTESDNGGFSDYILVQRRDPRSITDVCVEIFARIDGAAHVDYECDVTSTTTHLHFNAEGGTFNSALDRWEGDFLFVP